MLTAFLISFHAYGQTDSLKVPAKDTTMRALKKDTLKKTTPALSLQNDRDNTYHSPAKAGLFSAALPGLGQAYNRKFWKIPIIYLGGGVLMYQTLELHKNYKTFSCAYEKVQVDEDYTSCSDNIDDWDDILASGDPGAVIKKQKDNFRSQRDMFILYTSLLYFLNIVDAVVDAHLWEFNINDELSLKSKPAMYVNNNNYIFGGELTLSIK